MIWGGGHNPHPQLQSSNRIALLLVGTPATSPEAVAEGGNQVPQPGCHPDVTIPIQNLPKFFPTHRTKMPKKFNISLEGNIGSGKTTVLQIISKMTDFTVIPEPIDNWSNLKGINLLQNSYTDPKEHFFTLQMYIYLTQLQSYHMTPGQIRIFERSPHSSHKVFVEGRKQHFDQAKTEVCNEWYKLLVNNNPISFDLDLILYIKTHPEIALDRIIKRGRHEEKDLSLKTISELHLLHEQWLLIENKIPVLIIDGNKDMIELEKEVKNTIRVIKELTTGGSTGCAASCGPTTPGPAGPIVWPQ